MSDFHKTWGFAWFINNYYLQPPPPPLPFPNKGQDKMTTPPLTQGHFPLFTQALNKSIRWSTSTCTVNLTKRCKLFRLDYIILKHSILTKGLRVVKSSSYLKNIQLTCSRAINVEFSCYITNSLVFTKQIIFCLIILHTKYIKFFTVLKEQKILLWKFCIIHKITAIIPLI